MTGNTSIKKYDRTIDCYIGLILYLAYRHIHARVILLHKSILLRGRGRGCFLIILDFHRSWLQLWLVRIS
jgi:hypothetical protein